jgi:hypothetical protein
MRVVFELGEDVGLRLAVKSTQLNVALRVVASLFIAASGAQSQPSALQKPMVGCLRHSILMRGWAIICCR